MGEGDWALGIKNAIMALNLDRYESVLSKHQESLDQGRVPVLFSSHVLNDHQLDERFPFWKLKGKHFHSVRVSEISEKVDPWARQYWESRGVAPEDYSTLCHAAPEELIFRKMERGLVGHLHRFGERFDIAEDISVSDFGKDGLRIYSWDSLD